MVTYRTPYGLLGRALGHSISPEIHAALGNPNYSLYALEPDELAEFLADGNLRGVNVTIPYKQTVMPLCASLDPLAEAIGAVNTMVRQADGSWRGYNTDAYGLRCMMRTAGLSFSGEDVLIMGNGGVSQTIQAVAKIDGCRSLNVLDVGGLLTYDDMPRFYGTATLLVNATPVGMYPQADACLADLRNFTKLRGVADVIYNPLRTELLLQAERLGIPHAGGLVMLIAQAKQAAEHFFGKPVPDSKIAEIGAAMQESAENIVLIGMPGCGKTTVAAALAELTCRRVVDLDAEIVKRAGKSIPEIFVESGEAGFRQLETAVAQAVSSERGIIVSAGGGIVTREENYAPLRRNGRFYWLKRPLELLDRAGRPLSQSGKLSEMAEVRFPLYTQWADCEIDNTSTPEAAAGAIWGDFRAYTRSEWAESESSGNA